MQLACERQRDESWLRVREWVADGVLAVTGGRRRTANLYGVCNDWAQVFMSAAWKAWGQTRHDMVRTDEDSKENPSPARGGNARATSTVRGRGRCNLFDADHRCEASRLDQHLFMINHSPPSYSMPSVSGNHERRC